MNYYTQVALCDIVAAVGLLPQAEPSTPPHFRPPGPTTRPRVVAVRWR
jgi:hypothetical protein